MIALLLAIVILVICYGDGTVKTNNRGGYSGQVNYRRRTTRMARRMFR